MKAGSLTLRKRFDRGLTLIEVIIVIALVAIVYAMAMPNLGGPSSTEMSLKLSQIGGDIRGAFDTAVLTGRTHRLVFNLQSGDYHLEVADRENFFLSDERFGRDPTEEEEAEQLEIFEAQFRQFEDMAGEEIIHPETEEVIRPESPVLNAKERLRPPRWLPVQSMEWGRRSVGELFIIEAIQSEHHDRVQRLVDLGEEGRGFIYFFPNGYVQKAYIVLAFRRGYADIDEDQEPFTVVTDSFAGVAEIFSGRQEVDVHADEPHI